jgi:hypothetical protein
MHGRPQGWLELSLAARSNCGAAHVPVRLRAGGVFTARSRRMVRRGGVLIDGPVVASRQKGLAGDLVGTTGRASGNECGGRLTEGGGHLRGGEVGLARRRSGAG